MAEYINKDAYIKYLSSRKAEFIDDFGQGWCAGIDSAISACEKFPAADVEPVRHGRWVEQEKYTFGTMYDCSICENRILDNGHSWNYCPNCGARMHEEITKWLRDFCDG